MIMSSAAIEVQVLIAPKESAPLFELCVAPGSGIPFGTIALGQEDQVELCRQKHQELARDFRVSPFVEALRHKWSLVDKKKEALAQMLAKECIRPKFPGECELG